MTRRPFVCLTRVGITAVALEEETPRWIFELERIYEEHKKASKARRKREAQKAAEERRKQELEAMEKLKAVEKRLAKNRAGKRVIQRRFNMGVFEAIAERKASTLRVRPER